MRLNFIRFSETNINFKTIIRKEQISQHFNVFSVIKCQKIYLSHSKVKKWYWKKTYQLFVSFLGFRNKINQLQGTNKEIINQLITKSTMNVNELNEPRTFNNFSFKHFQNSNCYLLRIVRAVFHNNRLQFVLTSYLPKF